VQPDRGVAELLSKFARYCAQAHGCAEITVVDAQSERAPRFVSFPCDRFDCDALSAMSTRPEPSALSEDALAYCQFSLDRGLAASVAPERLRAAIRSARASLIFLAPNQDDRLIAPEACARALANADLHPLFTGTVRDIKGRASGRLAIVERAPVQTAGAPDDFRVLAIVPTFNEEDIIEQTLRYLTTQNIEVHLLDNWSTDRTVERARRFLGTGLVRIERFPADARPNTYDLTRILRRVEQIGMEATHANWIVLHDADERRCGPFDGVGLRDALWRADRSGYSCIDHVTLNFWPVDEEFDPERRDLEEHFQYFEFSQHAGHFHQRRAWRRSDAPVSLAASAGHNVTFAGRRIYPYKFLLKHYPIRSRAHGIRKVLQERRARLNPIEHAGGWHQQYEDVNPDHFVRERDSLLRFDPQTFADDYLIERLSGVGIYDEPPSWATPPRW
jgi:hypothetical protein